MQDETRSLVFTGHMIDLPGRPVPRFPPVLEAAARAAIAARIGAALAEGMVGFASGARGGDVLFHEAARGLGMRTVMVLPFAPGIFETTSVAGAATGDWAGRFRTLWSDTAEADRVVMGLPKESASYAACNARLIELAAARGRFRLIALWDGRDSGKPGGTGDMASKARAAGAEVDIIATQELRP